MYSNASFSRYNQSTLTVFWPAYFPSINDECSRFPTLRPNKFCLYPGLLVEILSIIAKDANLTLVSKTSDNYVGHKMPESDHLATLVQIGELDIIGMAFQKTEAREKVWDFSEYLYKANTRLLKRNEDHKLDKMWSFFKTYDSTTWTAFFIAWILQWIFHVIVRRFETCVMGAKRQSLSESAWSILRLQLLQPETIKLKSISGRLSTCIFALFQCSILMGLLSSIILANILKEKSAENPLSDMVSQIMSGQYYMVTNDPGKWFFDKINKSDEIPYPQLRLALASNPLRVVSTRSEAFDRVVNDNAIFFQQTDEGSFFESMAHCGITVIDTNMPSVTAHLFMRQNHPLMRKINETIIRNRHRLIGIALKYYKLALTYDRCADNGNYRALTITPYFGLVFICLVIIIIALISFGIEVWNDKTCRN